MSAVPLLPRDIPDPPPAPQYARAPTELQRIDRFLGELAGGTPLVDAMGKTHVTRALLEAFTRADEANLQRFNDARLAGLKRVWSVLDFEEVFNRIAAGEPVTESVIAIGRDPSSFFNMINKDPALLKLYRQAKEAHTLIMAEQLTAISDDNSNDTLPGPKGGEIPNMAAVTRSKLMVDTRFRYMGSFHAKLFGEKKDAVQVNVNVNHAQILEDARARATQRDKRITPKQRIEAIDAQFTEKQPEPADDTSWMDEKPADAVWREEK